MSRVEVLLSAMHLTDFSIVKTMNIQTDAVIVNQCDRLGYDELTLENGAFIRMYSFPDRGVGQSRNIALMHSKAEICLMADDDVVYEDGYEQKILDAFDVFPKADLIVCNVVNMKTNTGVSKSGKLSFFKSLKYGTYKFAFRRESILKKNIFFSLLFGGGAPFSAGEDSLFLRDCYKAGLKVYTCSTYIGGAHHATSTWFKGYNEKLFFDKGVLNASISPRLAYLMSIRSAWQFQKFEDCQFGFWQAAKIMFKGIKHYRKGGKLV